MGFCGKNRFNELAKEILPRICALISARFDKNLSQSFPIACIDFLDSLILGVTSNVRQPFEFFIDGAKHSSLKHDRLSLS